MPITLELDESIVFVALKHNLSFNEYKLLAEWLDCYNYVLPADRALHTAFIRYMTPRFYTSTDVFKLWMKANIIESTLTWHKQGRLLSWIPLQ